MKSPLISEPATNALARGNVRKANVILGFEYSIEGKVVHGNHIGRTLGFPTANLELEASQPMLPAHGVYRVRVGVNGHLFQGITNIGLRPTIDGRLVTVEVNIFDFDGDIYGHQLVIWFLDRIRKEKKFNSLDELAAQIKQDKKKALSLFSRFR